MFGAALPASATTGEVSGSQALAELNTAGQSENNAAETNVITADPAAITAGVDELAVGQLVVEDSVMADNVDLSLTVSTPAAQAARSTAGTTYSSASAGPLLSASEAGSLVSYARQFIGTPYRYGGTTPAAFDCSGFVQYVYAQFGVSLPRTSGAQAAAGHRISAAEAQPGDLVVWGTHHIGIYTGNGNHIAAHQPGVPLSETGLYGNYYFVRIG
ncbi:MAG: C40 family peptidase [Actinomycetaceae bacterium]|nr:C40 family peptidase [Actinomycetaceae bacterium]